MSFVREVVCPRCSQHFNQRQLLNLCPCGSPLLVRYDLEGARKNLTKSSLPGRVASLWRYRELLPVEDEANVISLGEGFTPLLDARKLATELGLRQIWIKDEAQNPTGS